MTATDIEPAAEYLRIDADALREAVALHGADLSTLTQAEQALTAALTAIREAMGVDQ